MLFFVVLVLGLVAGLIVRKARPSSTVNPGMVALGSVAAALAVFLGMLAIAAAKSPDPEGLGYVLGLAVGSAGIPLVIAAMLAVFMKD